MESFRMKIACPSILLFLMCLFPIGCQAGPTAQVKTDDPPAFVSSETKSEDDHIPAPQSNTYAEAPLSPETDAKTGPIPSIEEEIDLKGQNKAHETDRMTNDSQNRLCERKWSDGRHYVGDCMEEIPHGLGTMTYPDGKQPWRSR